MIFLQQFSGVREERRASFGLSNNWQTGMVEGQRGKEVGRNLGCCVYKVDCELQTGYEVRRNPEGLIDWSYGGK